MEIIANVSKLVKPSTPTPSTLRNYNLSFFDHIQPNMNVPLILYYFGSQKEQSDIQTKIFDRLEISLSKALVEFYPLAGRYSPEASLIDCSDQGALYVQAKAKFRLSDFLGLKSEMKPDMLQDFLPREITKASNINDPILRVKVTSFECGGVAIGMCISHKFGDMDTFSIFINNWATKVREMSNELELKFEKYSPVFNFAHLFPKPDTVNDRMVLSSKRVNNINYVLRVFSFKGSAITRLREKIMSDAQDNIISHRPSKVQLSVALLWKALMDIDKADGQSKVSFVSQAFNLRNNIKVPENSCGNFITIANASVELNEGDNTDLHVLLKLLHDSTNKIRSNNSKDYGILSKPFLEHIENATRNDVKVYGFTSWCKFSFHTADFGWGKPVWRSTIDMKIPNCVVMIDDDEGDGVEAWVSLDTKQMCELEQNPNIQAYMDVRF